MTHIFKCLLFSVISLTFFCAEAKNEPYKNHDLSPEERADDLLGRLTLEEKISLMMDDSPAIERLGIPKYNWWNEALHGVGRAGLATVLPQCIGLAATFDAPAIHNAYSMVSDEARAKYNRFNENGERDRYKCLTFWTPNVNIFRDPRWGRGQETYGEDPYLTTVMGVAVVKGLQGEDPANHLKTLAGAKHYAVHSGPEWNRHSFNAENISTEDLWETYLPAFKALVDAGVGQVMCAYNSFEGEPCCSNKKLLTEILRNEWGYDNIIVTDCWAMNDFFMPGHHETHKDAVSASADAVLSGTDLECGPVFSNLKGAIEKGIITEDKINESVKRLLKARFALGEMDSDEHDFWSSIPYSIVNCDKHKAIALDLARKSMTLLKNNGILPLSKSDKALMVIGPNAEDSIMQLGNYNGKPAHTVTILEGIRSKIPDIKYEKGCSHIIDDLVLNFDPSTINNEASTMTAASIKTDSTYIISANIDENRLKDVETVIFVGGISPNFEGEEMPVSLPGFRGGDRESIELPQIQREYVKKLKEAGKKVVFVNCSGSAIGLTPEDSICDAILQAWYPGESGGIAVADVLFGDYNPAGRLPITFYKDDSQLPDFEDYDMDGRTYRFITEEPLYPFGFGLSYTDFSYKNAEVIRENAEKQSLIFAVDVTNEGDRDGDEVVQLYVKRTDEERGPFKSLKGFKRVNIPAGETITVKIELEQEAFATYDQETDRLKIKPGEFKIFYGGNSATDNYVKITI